jgi:two-component system, chemotaxis family, protein-glutamate methylesterase/glutaminase
MASRGQRKSSTEPARKHEIVVIGGSAGALAGVTEILSRLPADLGAAVFVVLHMSATYPSALPALLTRSGNLRVRYAMHGELIVPNQVYVAPPDNHLIVRPGYVQVVRGPKENGFRPSVDMLFRSAAAAYGSSVIGIVLSGALDCGTAGLLSIKQRGGVALVQDPKDAVANGMPLSAIEHVPVDRVLPMNEIPNEIVARLREPAESKVENLSASLMEMEGSEPGVPVEFVCPACNGALTESQVNDFTVLRCHVGHTFTMESIAREQSEELERALWVACRALEESAALSQRLAIRSQGDLADRFREKQEAQMQSADVIRRILNGEKTMEGETSPLLARENRPLDIG